MKAFIILKIQDLSLDEFESWFIYYILKKKKEYTYGVPLNFLQVRTSE